jgi:hypothetical protein
MIQCDICRDWLHGDCVKVEIFVKNLNPTVFLIKKNV